ncbi:PfkB family carbohydrate kinase [Actinotalea sp.]|uniref:PfkB family carbohydrate kinase n=1 Tax=Actinotalea sp. TaxID=1872145 RepID=UPI00356AB33B
MSASAAAASRPIDRLVSVGNVVIDLVARVDSLPERGGDVLASGGRLEPGGGFNLMVAARRQGLPTAYAGTTGTGPFGDLARAALAREGIDCVHAAVRGVDTGFDVALVDADGERTFVTAVGAEAELTVERLDAVEIRPTDALVISGYSLLHPANRAAILGRLPSLPAETLVVYDPGPLGHQVSAADLCVLHARIDWWSGNAREVLLATGEDDPERGAGILATLLARARVVVRTGASGCLLADPSGTAVTVPGFPVEVLDTNGAGDAHVGVMISALAEGLPPKEALVRANAAAAVAVTREGPAQAPERDELESFLLERRPGGAPAGSPAPTG